MWTQEEIQRAIEEVSKRAATDKEFRKLCLENPAEAVKQVTGKEIPEGFKIKVVESDPNYDETFVLPPFKGEELSEEELDKVAGGKCTNDCKEQGTCHKACANQQWG